VKITIVQGAFLPVPPLLGGAVEKLWHAMGREFARQGHEVTHISRCYGDLKKEEKVDGVHYLRTQGAASTNNIPLLKFRDLFYTCRVLGLLPKADILVSNTFWLPILARNPLHGKLVVSVERMPKGQMRFYGNAAMLRACSSAVANAIRAESPGLVDRIRVLANPLPFEHQEQFTDSAKEPIVLYVGRIHPEKGVDLLVRAAGKLPKEWKVVILGPSAVAQGGGGEEYLQSLKRLAGDAHVEFHPPVFDAVVLAGHYSRASLFAYPTIAEQGEAMPIAPLEAMSFGCVPVVPVMECFADYITEGLNGAVFRHREVDSAAELASTLNALILDRDQRDRLSRQARSVCESHSLKKVAGEFLDAFAELMP
jgi:glycosyltransferase involved in cell wall biosynthesis